MALSACAITTPELQRQTSVLSPTPFVQPSLTPLPPTAPPPTLTLSPAVEIREQPGPLYETLFSIPVGEGGVTYRGGGVAEMQTNGPNALAFTPDDALILTDPVSYRLLKYDLSGRFLSAIDLLSLDILNVVDLRASETGLVLLEISLNVAPPRFRVHRLSFDGELIATAEIPEGFRLENGLSGIAVDCEGDIFLEIEGGFRLYRLAEVLEKPADEVAPSEYRCQGKAYRAVRGDREGTPILMAGDVALTTSLTTGFGGLGLLGVLADGSLYVTREDVLDLSVVKVDKTVHYLDAQGHQRGVARFPLDEYFYYVLRSLAIGREGRVYALLPRSNAVEIVRLNFYHQLEPLLPNGVVPSVDVANTLP
ncbi:MAG: hypothetical protein RML93_03595 [Anaerolineales bacterium]|nr:hypothetical protein [Anaerolineales bacterium]MDW8446359.1 hypothetical protein [Anaerolineales bacterium]